MWLACIKIEKKAVSMLLVWGSKLLISSKCTITLLNTCEEVWMCTCNIRYFNIQGLGTLISSDISLERTLSQGVKGQLTTETLWRTWWINQITPIAMICLLIIRFPQPILYTMQRVSGNKKNCSIKARQLQLLLKAVNSMVLISTMLCSRN